METNAIPNVETTLPVAGVDLHVEHYPAQGTPRAALVMVHGFSAHCGLYRHVGAAFSAQGIAVTQFDCRGHGRSGGRRGHIGSFKDYLDDLELVIAWARTQNPVLPLTLMGHSMGGAIALGFVLAHDQAAGPSRLVVAAPWLRLKMNVSLPKRAAAGVMARMFPKLLGPNGIKAKNISRNPLVLAGFEKDPLVHHVASAGWFMAMLRAQANIRVRAQDLKVPTLMLLAEQDFMVSNETNRTFAENAGNTVEVRSYGGLYHELFLEPEVDMLLADIAAWLLADSAPKKTT